ncbi:ABC transporter substrate binding protein [Candidatus Halobeggiatoa sp. HSG11]|nr:ABC transporter substrate binding protein [Candidatus Halobeggiatoa sp. HSG11]
MKPRINKIMMAIFFICLGIYLVWSAVHRPRVFVLQSYTNDYSWTRDVDSAIRKVFSTKTYDVKYHYMDTKKHSDAEFKRVAGSLARKQINEWKPDILIAVDDNAQSLVSVCYVDPNKVDINQVSAAKNKDVRAIFGKCYADNPNIKVIFAGIGAQPKDYGFKGQDNVAGIVERMDIPALKEALLLVAEKTNKLQLKVIAPIDDSTSGTYNYNSLLRLKVEMEPLGIIILPQIVKTFSEWRAIIEQANSQADFLLFSNYHTIKCTADPKAKRVPPDKLIEWTETNSRTPGIGAWGFYVENGGMLSVGVSPFEQGEMAANIAVDILDEGVQPNQIEVKTTHQSIILMQEALIKYYDLKLPRIYEAFARAAGYFKECTDQNDCWVDIQRIAKQKNEHLTHLDFCGKIN